MKNPNTGDLCGKCLGGHYLNCTKGKCIHGSLAKSVIGTMEATFWKWMKVYKQIDTIICCSHFLKTKLDTDSVLAKKTVVLHNFVDQIEKKDVKKKDYVLFFGRYSQEKGIAKEEVAGVGIGVPGPVRGDGSLDGAVNLHWGYHNIPEEMGALTGLHVKAGNDANVAALGEMWRGGGAGYNNLIMVTLGTGVGGGIVHDGKIVAGAHGAGGEIGHVHVEDAITTPCNCGLCGCLEQVASATGIANLAKAELAVNKTPTILKGDYISAKTVFDAYKKGDEVAGIIVNRFAEYLGKALAQFAAIVDPDVFVIGGGVSKAGNVLIECVEKYFKENAISFYLYILLSNIYFTFSYSLPVDITNIIPDSSAFLIASAVSLSIS